MKTTPNMRPELDGAKIFVVSHGFQTAYERGFCNALAANGGQVVLAGSDNTDLTNLHSGVRLNNIRGSQNPARSRLIKALNLCRYHIALLCLAWQTRNNCLHVIGLTDPPLLTGILEGALFRMVSRRYLLTVHNVLPHDRHTLWNRILYRFIYRIPSRLIVHTITMRERLVSEFGVCRSRIVVMDHGCELGGHLDPLPRQKSRKPLKLLFFGAVAHYKGVDVLLSSFAMLANDVSLKIIGACRSPQLQHEIERTVAELGSTGRSVSWRNEYVPEEDMAAAFHWADVLVLPYRHIDQSGVVFQALKFGVPIIATRVGEFSQMVTADIGELCEPDDALSLVDAISQLAERIGTISSEKIASISKQYDWANTVRVLRSSYVE